MIPTHTCCTYNSLVLWLFECQSKLWRPPPLTPSGLCGCNERSWWRWHLRHAVSMRTKAPVGWKAHPLTQPPHRAVTPARSATSELLSTLLLLLFLLLLHMPPPPVTHRRLTGGQRPGWFWSNHSSEARDNFTTVCFLWSRCIAD